MEPTEEMNKALTAYTEGLTHFYARINFDKSFLDAEAIRFMTCGFTDLTEVIKAEFRKIPRF